MDCGCAAALRQWLWLGLGLELTLTLTLTTLSLTLTRRVGYVAFPPELSLQLLKAQVFPSYHP